MHSAQNFVDVRLQSQRQRPTQTGRRANRLRVQPGVARQIRLRGQVQIKTPVPLREISPHVLPVRIHRPGEAEAHMTRIRRPRRKRAQARFKNLPTERPPARMSARTLRQQSPAQIQRAAIHNPRMRALANADGQRNIPNQNLPAARRRTIHPNLQHRFKNLPRRKRTRRRNRIHRPRRRIRPQPVQIQLHPRMPRVNCGAGGLRRRREGQRRAVVQRPQNRGVVRRESPIAPVRQPLRRQRYPAQKLRKHIRHAVALRQIRRNRARHRVIHRRRNGVHPQLRRNTTEIEAQMRIV